MDTLEQSNELLTPVKITIYEKDRRKFKMFAAERKLTLSEAFEHLMSFADLWASAQKLTHKRLQEEQHRRDVEFCSSESVPDMEERT